MERHVAWEQLLIPDRLWEELEATRLGLAVQHAPDVAQHEAKPHVARCACRHHLPQQLGRADGARLPLAREPLSLALKAALEATSSSRARRRAIRSAIGRSYWCGVAAGIHVLVRGGDAGIIERTRSAQQSQEGLPEPQLLEWRVAAALRQPEHQHEHRRPS